MLRRLNAPRRQLTGISLPRRAPRQRLTTEATRRFVTNSLQSTNQLTSPKSLQQQQRQIHFLPLLGLWGAKHASAWTIYNACKTYGWPRVYRRLLEQNRYINGSNPSVRKSMGDLIRLAIEAPPKFAARVGQHAETVTHFLQRIAERAEPNLPSFMVAAIKYVVNSQKPVKILQDFAAAASKK